jgi:hypothetical protein
MTSLIAFFEIPSANFDRTVSFYETIFNINLPVHGCEKEKMAFFTEQEQYVGAISFAPNFTPSPNGVLIHFRCADIEGTLLRVASNGGEVITPKTKIDAGSAKYFAVFSDSEGNHIGLYSEN